MNKRKRQQRGLPWYREFDGWWYATIRGVKQKLVKGEDNKEEALKEWHRLMLLADALQSKDANPLWVIFAKYLDYIERDHPNAYLQYRSYLQGFKDLHGDLAVENLSVGHVKDWLASHPAWSDATRAHAIAVVSAALNWAVRPEQGIITRNPIKGMGRPPIRSRGAEAVIDGGDWETLYTAARLPIQDALLFLRQTGTRPGNLARITAESVDWAARCVRLSIHKTAKKTGRPLVIPLTQVAMDLLRRLADRHPDGPLFRTERGNVLTSPRLSKVIVNLKTKLKKEGKLTGNPMPYGCRHTVATELLTKDMPDAKVAAILGHKGVKMLYQHYGHLDKSSEVIAAELDRALNGNAERKAGE